jgi:voltage-gated potassium channel
VFLTGLTITFLKEFGVGIWVSFPVLFSLGLAIIILGQAVGRMEGWPAFDSFYWSFITGTTIGYGDIRPSKRASRVIAILIGLLGLTFTGILIAVAVHAGNFALAAHDAIEKVK